MVSTAPENLLRRVRSEYIEMPGLVLTLAQAARLWGVDTANAKRLLCELERSGFLCRTRDGAYRRPECR